MESQDWHHGCKLQPRRALFYTGNPFAFTTQNGRLHPAYEAQSAVSVWLDHSSRCHVRNCLSSH